ncbi:MAG: type II toxin-antitoxin system RelE/ParE family toxin [Oscillospiraceae bacterium]|jgi:mRNA interferase RelE/StbE|nr:type II toxin-antitoxin system RelE/ParE family toxin [Oscillospiraceae bacterium]
MPTYKIDFKKQAAKFIKGRTHTEQKRLLSEIYKLPNHKHVKKLEGYSNRYRLRVGNFRVIYDKLDEKLVILVVSVGNRGDVYK